MKELPAPALPDWLHRQLPFRRYRVEVEPGIAMHVMEQGSGRPVVLFHGNPTWGYLYRKVAAELEGEPFRLIMPDLVGLGMSDRPATATEHTFANHARWMASLLAQLQLEDVIAVGQDWGGPIGVHAMSRNPGLMTGLILMNTSITPPRPGFKPTSFHRFFSTPLGSFATRYLGLPQRALRLAQGDRSSITGEVSRAYSFPLTRARGNDAVWALVRMVPDSMGHPSVPLLGETGEFVASFSGPAAIVWGTKDPVLGRLMRRHHRLLPDAFVTETDAGHFLQEEVPADIAQAIRAVAAG